MQAMIEDVEPIITGMDIFPSMVCLELLPLVKPETNKNKFRHNDDGTTHIFVESKNKRFPGRHTIIIDTEDWDAASEYRWSVWMHSSRTVLYAQALIYLDDPEACRIAWREGRNPRRSSLRTHHLVMGKPPKKGWEIDHINHNGLDNRKDNLRFVTRAQNQYNRRSNRSSSSNYKGVSWNKRDKRWLAQIKHEGKQTYIGNFTCEHQAALAYNKKAIELWGEHVLLNDVATSF